MLNVMRLRESKGFRFILTGLIVNLSLLAILEVMLRAGLNYRIAVTISYCLGMVWGYAQNRIWSWQSTSPVFASFRRYLLVYAVIFVLHLVFVMLLVEGLSVAPLIAALISAIGLVLPVFFVLDRFVFSSGAS